MKQSEIRPGLKRMVIGVPVATVWTTPESPRDIDMHILQNPAEIGNWASKLTANERLDLCTSNRTQTQVLYAEEVVVLQVRDGWADVRIPSQATRKDPIGYPGWIPYAQLSEWKRDIALDSDELLNAQLQVQNDAHAQDNKRAQVNAHVRNNEVQVNAKFTPMFLLSEGTEAPYLELSYLTKLPLIEVIGTKVYVRSPHGIGMINKEDVIVLSGSTRIDSTSLALSTPSALSTAFATSEVAPDTDLARNQYHSGAEIDTGRRIAAEASRFQGLAYLWGGLSAYGYDCSGYAYSMYASQGIIIPRDASDQALAGTEVASNQLHPGDLLFFAYEEGKGRIHHVGIYIGEGKMIHSPDSKSSIEVVELTNYKRIKEHCASRRYNEGL